jgi:serine phosphatase RsbU (regulator of sigma subunit)
MIKSILSEADKFADGAPQHDDMTLVIARVQ